MLNRNISKVRWNGAEESTSNHFIKLATYNFEYAILSANKPNSTAVSHINQNEL